MSDTDRRPAVAGSELRPFDSDLLSIYLNQLPADGSTQARTLVCVGLACGLALTLVPVQTRMIVEGTVHAVGRAHPLVAPIDGVLRWSSELTPAADRAGTLHQTAVLPPPGLDSRGVDVRRGQQIGDVFGGEPNTLVVRAAAANVLPVLSQGTYVVVRRLEGAEPSVAVKGRVSAVTAGSGPGTIATTMVHVGIDAPESTINAPTGGAPAEIEAGQRVRLSFESGRRSLWAVLSGGMGAGRSHASSAAASAAREGG